MRLRIFIVGILLFASCTGASRTRTLSVALESLNAMRDALVAYDAQHQERIVDSATNLEDGKRRLAEYRTRRERVTAALLTAYSALAVAASDTSGDRMQAAISAVVQVHSLIQAMTDLKDPDPDRTLSPGASP